MVWLQKADFDRQIEHFPLRIFKNKGDHNFKQVRNNENRKANKKEHENFVSVVSHGRSEIEHDLKSTYFAWSWLQNRSIKD